MDLAFCQDTIWNKKRSSLKLFIYEGLPAQQARVAIGAKVLSVNNLPMQTKEQFCSFPFKGMDSIHLKIEHAGEVQSYELDRVAYFPETQ